MPPALTHPCQAVIRAIVASHRIRDMMKKESPYRNPHTLSAPWLNSRSRGHPDGFVGVLQGIFRHHTIADLAQDDADAGIISWLP